MKSVLKSIYLRIPFKKQIFSSVLKVWKPSPSFYQHLNFKGVFNVRIDSQSSFKIKSYGYRIENELFWEGLYGGWEKDSMKLWVQLSKISNVIIDIGANSGIYSLVAKSVQPNSQVYAFEPVNRVYKKLVKNIELNGFDIVTKELAVSNRTGNAIVYDNLNEHVYSVTVNKNLFAPTTKVVESLIQTITLDEFISKNNIKNIDLIKIDVETHEPEVLEGFKFHLEKFKPTLLIEVLNEEIAEKINHYIKDLGYLYFNISEKGTIRQTDKVYKSDYFNYLICNSEIAAKLKLI